MREEILIPVNRLLRVDFSFLLDIHHILALVSHFT
jgi:hypothetical protein